MENDRDEMLLEALTSLINANNKQLSDRLDKMETEMNKKFDDMENRFDKIERRIEKIEQQLNGTETIIAEIREKVTKTQQDIKNVNIYIENVVEKKLNVFYENTVSMVEFKELKKEVEQLKKSS